MTLHIAEDNIENNLVIFDKAEIEIIESADKFDLLLVSPLDSDLLKKANITIVKILDEALELVYENADVILKFISCLTEQTHCPDLYK